MQAIRVYRSEDRSQILRLVSDFQTLMAQFDPAGLALPFRSSDDSERYVDQMLLDVEQRTGAIFVAEDATKGVVGFVSGIISRRPEDDDVMYATTHEPAVQGWIGLLLVSEEVRGNGIGRLLVEKMRFFFISNACTSMHLLVSPQNSTAISLYRNHGMIEREVEMCVSLDALDS